MPAFRPNQLSALPFGLQPPSKSLPVKPLQTSTKHVAYCPFTDKTTKAQRGEVACPRPPSPSCCPGYFPGLHFCHPCTQPLLNVFSASLQCFCITACFCQACPGDRGRQGRPWVTDFTGTYWACHTLPLGLDLLAPVLLDKERGLGFQKAGQDVWLFSAT